MGVNEAPLSHAQFRQAYSDGLIRVDIDPAAAARYVSARLLLPLVRLPILGTGVALALIGWVYTGLLVIALGIVLPLLIKRTAPHFVLTQALDDPAVYREAVETKLMRIVPLKGTAREE